MVWAAFGGAQLELMFLEQHSDQSVNALRALGRAVLSIDLPVFLVRKELTDAKEGVSE